MKNLVLVLGLVFSLALTSCGPAGEYKDCSTFGGVRHCFFLTLNSDGTMTADQRAGKGKGKWEEVEGGIRVYDFRVTKGSIKANGFWKENYNGKGYSRKGIVVQ